MRRLSHSLRPLNSVSTIDELLTHTDQAVLNGELIWVRSVGCAFGYELSSGLTPDGITVVATAFGPGVWVRQSQSSDPSWLHQAAWFVDSVNGNNENNGLTSSTAVATWAELRRRLMNGRIKVAATITILSNLAPTDPMILDFGSEAALTIQGLTTPVLSSHIGAFSARSPSTNALALLHDGTQVWAPFVDATHRIFMTGGAANGSQALVVSDTGGGTARVTTFVDSSGVEHTPGNGDAYTVSTVPTVDTLVLDPRLVTAVPIIIQNLAFLPSAGIGAVSLAGTGGSAGVLFYGCSMGSGPPAALASVAATLVGCRFVGMTAVGCRLKIYGGASFPGLSAFAMDFSDGGASELFVGFVVEATGIVCERGTFVNLADVAIQDFPATYGLIIKTSAKAFADVLWGVSGVATTVGCYIDVASQLEVSAANNRTLTGAANKVKIGNNAAAGWPAALATKTADATSLAALMHD